MNRFTIIMTGCALLAASVATANSFDPAAGKALWNQSHGKNEEGHDKSCVTCHTADIKQPGRHVKTGKPIDPMAPSVQADRFKDPEKLEKWFKRNCTWTLGRECTAQEKGDIMSYLQQN